MNENEKIYPNYFAIIPADIRYDKNIPYIAKLLYAEITSLSNKNGYCWATNKYFADLYEVSDRTISRNINLLIEHKYIASKIIYKNNTKEIDKRILIIKYGINQNSFIQNVNKNVHRGIDKNVHRGIDKNVQDNNININNIYSSNFDKNEAFKRFWDLYPRKTNKKKAKDSFLKKCTDENILNKMINAVINQKKSEQWQNMKYIPHATTWLNGERWEDELIISDNNQNTENNNNDDWMSEYE